MIRTIIGFFVVALGICAVIIIGAGKSTPEEEVTPVSVTRSEVVPTTAPVEAPVQKVVAAPVVANDVASRILAASGAAQPANNTLTTDDISIDQTTAGVLAALGVAGVPAPEPAPNSEMGQATSNALASIRGLTGKSAAPVKKSGLQDLIAAALSEGQSDEYIDALVNEAAAGGKVSVPEMLVTSDGRVDTATLLASIVQQATLATGGQLPEVPEVPLGPADGVEVRVVQRAGETQQYRFYTVSAGDSLGSISRKFYGSASYFPKIFEANRQILSSPDRIQAGQRLVIPELT